MTKLIIRVPKKREKEEFEVIFQPARKHQKIIKIEENVKFGDKEIIEE